MAGEHILIVEDDPAVQTLLLKALTAKGYRVTQALDGLAGLTALERERPDLIIADIMMPRLDGMVVCRRLKDDPRTAMVPVIFLTARSQQFEVQAGLNLGALGYIIKPFDTFTLSSEIVALLAQQRKP